MKHVIWKGVEADSLAVEFTAAIGLMVFAVACWAGGLCGGSSSAAVTAATGFGAGVIQLAGLLIGSWQARRRSALAVAYLASSLAFTAVYSDGFMAAAAIAGCVFVAAVEGWIYLAINADETDAVTRRGRHA